jgi:hypothetical protein
VGEFVSGFSFKSQAAQKPTAAGSLLQQSAYGQTIPKIYGTTQSPLLAIWAANLRQGGSIKKFKQFKKGITSYVENIDFLLGHNPIMGVLQVMVNGGNFPLNFTSQSFAGGPSSYTVTDPEFYFVTAVTMQASYSFTVDDYGGQGSQTFTGTFEIPLWNELETGPDPTHPASARFYPYLYRWLPGYGATIYIDTQTIVPGTIKIYYAQLKDATSFQVPIAKLKLAFEQQLGSGSEYSDAGSPFDAQQIIYPMFAGLGSSEIDLGASGALPQLLPEVRGKWGVYPSMDTDFVDMIEDIFKSGLAQAAAGLEPMYTQLETGLSSYNLPGCVQYKSNSNEEFFDPGIPYNLPNTAGNLLVAIAAGSASTISDTAGNTWTPVFGSSLGFQVWTATAVGGDNVVSIPGLGFGWQITLLEIAGVDTIDQIAFNLNRATEAVASTVEPNFPAYLLGITLYTGGFRAPTAPIVPQWDNLAQQNFYGYQAGGGSPDGNAAIAIEERIVRTPGTYGYTMPGDLPAGFCILSFKASQPVTNPRPLGDFINLPALDLVRAQCRAYGLWGSLSMNSQSSASDWLKTLCAAANAAPVFLGSELFLYPYSEVSAVGNGCTYTSPTAPGPIAELSDLNGDFVGNDGCPMLTTVDRINLPNVLQMQCIDRDTNYNQVTIQQPEAASIALYGERKADPVVNNAVQDPSVARALLGIQTRRNQYGGDQWEFTLSARWSLLSPMDLITLTDTLQGLYGPPVRIKSYNEQKDGSFVGTAEPFVYGMCAPTALSTTSPTVNPNTFGASAGDVNPPIIFEPVPGLYPNQVGDQIWVVVSSQSENYGGAQIYVSTDGGSTYNPAPGLSSPPSNIVTGSAITGATTNDWPAASDPDSTNDLDVDLTESNGALLSYPTTAENNFEYPCYVEAETFGLQVNAIDVANAVPLGVNVNGTPEAALGTVEVNTTAVAESGSAAFDYELMTYAVATLTSTHKYTLMATGAGNFLRRAVYDAPAVGNGVDHAIGSRFAFLSPAGTGILKMAMPLQYIGQELFFKIVSFNQFGAALQSLSDVPAYSYTPTGIPGTV